MVKKHLLSHNEIMNIAAFTNYLLMYYDSCACDDVCKGRIKSLLSSNLVTDSHEITAISKRKSIPKGENPVFLLRFTWICHNREDNCNIHADI